MIRMRTCLSCLCTLGMIFVLTGITASARGVDSSIEGPAPLFLRLSGSGDASAELSPNLQGAIRTATGKITLLRVHELGSGYGPPNDFINVEVVIQLDSEPGKAFGFPLRRGARYAANEAMLQIVRTAFEENTLITIDYVYLNRSNSIMLRAVIVPPEPVQLGYPMYIRLSKSNGSLPLINSSMLNHGSPLDKKEAYR